MADVPKSVPIYYPLGIPPHPYQGCTLDRQKKDKLGDPEYLSFGLQDP